MPFMPLVNVSLPIRSATVPRDVRAFLREARRRIDRFNRASHVPAFVASDFEPVYATLVALADAAPATGSLFCEWGSGFGVVACLAAMLDFDACGIEIEAELVEAARDLADDFGLPVEFVQGSFIPAGYDVHARGDEFAWLTTGGGGQDELDLSPDDFDVIFAYPWPDEEHLAEDLFRRRAREGALLVTHHGGEDVRVRRKTARRRGQP